MASERMNPKIEKGEVSWAEHYARYIFASQFVKGKKVLDVSCGNGYGSHYLAESGRANEVIGVDISKKAISYAKRNYNHKKVRYIEMDAQKLDLDPNHFDVVISFETIEHLPNYEKFLQGVKKCLKKDGLFIVSTPNKKTYPSGNPFHIKEFNFQEFNDLLRDRFKEVKFVYQDNWITSGIFSEKMVGYNSLSKDVDIVKIFKLIGRNYQDSLFFITLCSDGKISQQYSQTVALYAFTLGVQEWLGQLTSREKQLQDKVSNLDLELNETTKNLNDLKKHLDSILSSRRWKLIDKIGKIKRAIPIVGKF